MDDLVKRLTIKAGVMEMGEVIAWGSDTALMRESAARIDALEQDLKAVLRREEDANRAAMKHLRALEQERIKSKNYADFNHEWRRRCDALEAQVKAADALAEALEAYENAAVDHMDFQSDLDAALAAYRATKEGGA